MADNYIKISKVPCILAADALSVSGKNDAGILSTDGTLYNLGEIMKYHIDECVCPDNMIYISLVPTLSELSFSGILHDSISTARVFVEGPATNLYTQLPITRDGETPNIIAIDLHEPGGVSYKAAKNVIISSIKDTVFDSTEAAKINSFKKLTFSGNNIDYLELCDSTLQSLEVHNCKQLTKCVLGEFNGISNISIKENLCYGGIRIGTLSDNPIINITDNNQLTHIEFRGNGITELTDTNCVIKGRSIKSVCFINCKVSEALLNQLENKNIEVIKIKKAV